MIPKHAPDQAAIELKEHGRLPIRQIDPLLLMLVLVKLWPVVPHSCHLVVGEVSGIDQAHGPHKQTAARIGQYHRRIDEPQSALMVKSPQPLMVRHVADVDVEQARWRYDGIARPVQEQEHGQRESARRGASHNPKPPTGKPAGKPGPDQEREGRV